MRRLPWEVLALAALGIARLLPEHGVGLGLRLAAATLCLMLPGALIARALGDRGPSASLVWSLTALFPASVKERPSGVRRSNWLPIASSSAASRRLTVE